MENYKATVLDQFTKLEVIIIRALSKAVEELDIKEILRTVSTNEERLPRALRTLLTSFMIDQQKKQNLEEEIVTFPQYRRFQSGERDYEIIPIAQRHENYFHGQDLMKRAEAKGANLGEEEGNHILNHQNEIPSSLRKFSLVFTNWRSEDQQTVAYLAWNGKEWTCRWRPINQNWQQAYSWWLIKRLK